MSLKEKLLNLNLCVDNKYLDKYCELIENNKDTKREKFKTQKHHIIPKCYYKYNNLKIDNSKENLVNLLYKDHILAHYYLCLCSKENNFKYANANSIFHIMGNTNYVINQNHENEINLIKHLDQYQTIYEYLIQERSKKYKGHVHTIVLDKQKEQISIANEGLLYVYNENNLVIKIEPQNTNEYLSRGWKLGNPLCKNKNPSKKKSGVVSIKDRITINNGMITKVISKKDFELYLSKGWKKGKTKILELEDLNLEQLELITQEIVSRYGCFINKESQPQKIRLTKDNETFKIKSYQLYNYLLDGWKYYKRRKLDK